MFETNFSEHNKIWEGTKKVWGHCPRMPPVSAGLGRTVARTSSIGYTYHHMWKSQENDAMPYARESPDKEKTNHKYKDKIPEKYIKTADPSNSRVIMA